MTIRDSISLSKSWWTFVYLLFVCVQLNAQTSASYIQKSSAYSSGSGSTSSASYKLHGTLGQSFIGAVNSTSYNSQVGFESNLINQSYDLTLSNLTLNPSSVVRGNDITAFFTVRNIGSASEDSNVTVAGYLSVNPTYENTDQQVLSATVVASSLAASTDLPITGGLKITIPATVAPGSYFIVLVVATDNSKIESNVNNNAISSSLSVTTPGNDTSPPTIFPVPAAAFSANLNVSVTVTDDKAVNWVRFIHRPIIGTDYDSVTLTGNGSSFTVSLQEGWADQLGVEGYFRASDNAGNIAKSSKIYWYRQADPNTIIPFTSNFGGTMDSYAMFSIPYDLESKGITSVFDELSEGRYDKSIWRVFHYQSDSYKENETMTIQPGSGYWINMKTKTDVAIGAGSVVKKNQNEVFSMTLDKGWNQIGNPYPFNIDWPSIKSANPNAGLNSLWLFESGQYTSKDVLATWKGAFVFSDNGGQIVIPISSKTNAGGRITKNGMEATLDNDRWLLPMTMSFNDISQTSAVGMHPEASTSKDKFDEMTIPRFMEYLEMKSTHNEFFSPYFSTDVVPTVDKYEWTFELESSQKEGNVSLGWDQSAFGKDQSAIMLIDLLDETWLDMKTSSAYNFSWKDGRKIKIAYSRDGVVDPGITFVGQSYPNPFVSSVSIPVLVSPDQLNVQINIYDLLGHKVKTVTNVFQNPGMQVVNWDGKDDSGNDVAAGLLIYRSMNASNSSAKRMVKK
ncbi:MAG TPA: FlgD immunoglobulin-like domain containing protein [Cyclobacteriaceae bacterium]|jgi:hypothetical protein|nr:FlgD immunoglobulin-like domain containing protein [Cyclobacteriaceae bacterium]